MDRMIDRTRFWSGLGCAVALLCALPPTPAGAEPAKVAQGPAMPPEVTPNADSAQRPDLPPAPLPCDANCVRRNADAAAQACVPAIEARAPQDYDWLSRPFGGMFTQAEQPGADGIVRYRGDSIRVLLQNQWLRHAYECSWDTAHGRIVAVQLRPGRLVPPAAIAQLGGGDAAKDGKAATVTAKSPEEVQRMIQQSLQRAAGGPAAPAPAAAKPKPGWSEPSIISVRQSHLRTAQIDSAVSISQSPRTRRAERPKRTQ